MIELSTIGSVIKAVYEGQPNTNAFTDAEKVKLAGLMTGIDEVFLARSQRAAADGVASLDSTGKVPMAQLNVSGLQFKGSWNPLTNTPALVDGTGSVGDFYKAGVAGSYNTGNGTYTYAVGDWIIFAAGVWQRIGSSDAVASVNGKLGEVILTAADVGALPASYVPPAAVTPTWAALPDKPTIPAPYVPPAPPKLVYAVPSPARVAGTWYTNNTLYDRIVQMSTNWIDQSGSSTITMRAAGTTTPTFISRSLAVGTGFSNQSITAIIPSGWQYNLTLGTGRTISEWYEGNYS